LAHRKHPLDMTNNNDNDNNVTMLPSDMRLRNLYNKIWGALEEGNRANPLTYAAVIGVLTMITQEVTLISIGVLDEDDGYDDGDGGDGEEGV